MDTISIHLSKKVTLNALEWLSMCGENGVGRKEGRVNNFIKQGRDFARTSDENLS